MSKCRKKQKVPQDVGIEREIKNCDLAATYIFFLYLTLDGCLEELNTT